MQIMETCSLTIYHVIALIYFLYFTITEWKILITENGNCTQLHAFKH